MKRNRLSGTGIARSFWLVWGAWALLAFVWIAPLGCKSSRGRSPDPQPAQGEADRGEADQGKAAEAQNPPVSDFESERQKREAAYQEARRKQQEEQMREIREQEERDRKERERRKKEADRMIDEATKGHHEDAKKRQEEFKKKLAKLQALREPEASALVQVTPEDLMSNAAKYEGKYVRLTAVWCDILGIGDDPGVAVKFRPKFKMSNFNLSITRHVYSKPERMYQFENLKQAEATLVVYVWPHPSVIGFVLSMKLKDAKDKIEFAWEKEK